MALCCVCAEARADQAPAPRLTYGFGAPADIVVSSVMVPASPTIDTYYEAMGWNFNAEGAGYTGIQFSDKRVASGTPTFIFSLWDPLASKAVVTADYLDAGVTTERAVEGTSFLASINWARGWLPDRWYTLAVRRWDCHGSKTCFALWIHKEAEGQWIHHATMVHPVAKLRINGYVVAFLEDWSGSGEYRSVRYRDAWARTAAGWQSLWQATLAASEAKPVVPHAYRGFVDANAFGLEAGAGVASVVAQADLSVAKGTAPGFLPPAISAFTATLSADKFSVQLSWTLDESKSPQFAYAARLVRISDGRVVALVSATVPQARSATLPVPVSDEYRAELEVTDIFDQPSAVASQPLRGSP
jgi:hypothetical protein